MSSSEDHPLKKLMDTSLSWFGVDSREFSSDKLLDTAAQLLDPNLFKPVISAEDEARLKALGQSLNQAGVGALDESGLMLETQKNEATKKFWSSFLQKREEFTRSGFSIPAFQKENPLYGLVGHKDSYLQSLLVFYEENGVPLFSYDKQLRLLTETTDWSGARLSKEEARKVIQYWIGKYGTVSSRYALYGRIEAREFSEGRKYLGQEMRKRDPQKALQFYEQASKLSSQDRSLSLEALEFQWRILKENRGDFFQIPGDFLAEVNGMIAGEAEDFLQAKALRLRGEIAIAAGEKEEALSYFQRSLRLSNRLYDSEKVLYSGFRLDENPEESRYSLTNLSILTEEIRSLSGRVESEVLRGESLLRVNETRKALVEFKNHHASLQHQAGSKEANFEQTSRWSIQMSRFEKITEGIEAELKQTESSLQKDLSQFVPSVSTCDGMSVGDARIEIEKSRLLAHVRRELAVLHPDAKSEESYYSALTIWRALLSSASPVSDLELNPPIKDQMLELTKELMLFRSKVEKHPERFASVGGVDARTALERSREIRRVFSEQRNAQLRPLLEKLKPKERKELESLLARLDEKADRLIEELVSKGEKVLESEIIQKLERLFQEVDSDSVFKKIVSYHPFLKFIIDQETKILRGLGILKEEDPSRISAIASGERGKELLGSIHFEISCLSQGLLNQFSEVEQMRFSGLLSRIVEEGDLESADRYLSKSGLEDYLKKSGEADVLFSKALEVRQRVEKLNSPEGKKLRLVDKEGRVLTPQEIELFKEQSLSMEESYILSALSHYEELGEGLKVQKLKEWSERELLPRLEERERARFRQSVNGIGMGKELAEAKLLVGAYVEASFRNDGGLNFAVLPNDITDEDRFIRWLQHQAGQQDEVLWNDPYRQALKKPEVVELLKKVFRAERSEKFVSYTKEERAEFREVLLRLKRELINPSEGKELGSWGKVKLWLLGPELKAFVAHHSSNKGGRALLQGILKDEKNYTLETRVALGYKVAAQLGDQGWVDENRMRSAENIFAEAVQTIESAQFLLEVAEVRHEEIEKNQEKNEYSEIVERNKKRWGAEVRMESRLATLADAIKKDSNWKGLEDQEWRGTKINKVREIALKKLDLLLKEASELESKGETLSVSEREKALLIFNQKVAEFAKSDLLPDRSSELKDFFNLLPVRKRQPVSDLTRYTRELDFATHLGHEVIIASTRFPIQNEKLQKLEKQVQALEEALLTLELSLIHQYKEGGWVVRGIANVGEVLGVGHLEKLVKAINAIKQIRLNLAQKIEEASKEFAKDEKGLENRVEDLLQGALGDFFKLTEEGGAISEVREVVGETEFKTIVDLVQTTVEMMVVGGVAGALMKGGKWLSAIRKAQNAAKVLEAGAVTAESGAVLAEASTIGAVAEGVEGIESLEAVANAFGEAAKGVKFHWTIELSSAVAAGNVEASRFIFKELGRKLKGHLEHHLGEAAESFLFGGIHSSIANPLFQQWSGGYSEDQWEFYDRFVAFVSTGLSMFITKFIPEGGNAIRWGMKYQLRAVSELWGRAGAVGLLKWTAIGMLKWGVDLGHAATVETLEELIDGIAAAVCKGARVDEDLIRKTTRSVMVGAAAMHKGQKLMSGVFHAVSGSGHADIFQKVAEEAGLDHLPKQAIQAVLKAMVEYAFQQAMAEGKDLGEIEEEDVERILKNLFSVMDQLVKMSGMQGKGLETFRLDLIQKALLSGLNPEELQKRATFVLEQRARIEQGILTPLVGEANLNQPQVQNTVNWFIGILFSNSFQGTGNRHFALTDLSALEQIKSEVDRWSRLAVSMAPDLQAALDTYLGKEESGSAERAYLTLLFFTDRFNSKESYSYENKIDEIDSELQKIQKGLQTISKEFGGLVNELLGCLKLPEKEIPKAREVLVHWLLEIRKAKTKEDRDKALSLIEEKAWVAAGGEASLLAPMQTVICRFVDQQISEEALKAAEGVIGKIAGFRQQWNRDRMEAAKREGKGAAGFNAEREGDGKSNGEGSEGFLNEERKEKLENNVAVTAKPSLANRSKLGQIAQRGSRWIGQHPAIFMGIACAISVAKPVIGLMAQHFGMDLGVGFSPDLHPLQSLAEGVSGWMVVAGVRTAGNEEGGEGEESAHSGQGNTDNFQEGEKESKKVEKTKPSPSIEKFCQESLEQLEMADSVLKGKAELENRYRQTVLRLQQGEITEFDAQVELNEILKLDYIREIEKEFGIKAEQYTLAGYLKKMGEKGGKIPPWVKKIAERFPDLSVYKISFKTIPSEKGLLKPGTMSSEMMECLEPLDLYEPNWVYDNIHSPTVFFPDALLSAAAREMYGDQAVSSRLTTRLSTEEEIFEMVFQDERPTLVSPIPTNPHSKSPKHPAHNIPHEHYHRNRTSGYSAEQRRDAVLIAKAFQSSNIPKDKLKEMRGVIVEQTSEPKNDESYCFDLFRYVGTELGEHFSGELIAEYRDRLTESLVDHPRRAAILEAFQKVFGKYLLKLDASKAIADFCVKSLDQLKDPNSVFAGKREEKKQYRLMIQKFHDGKILKKEFLVQAAGLLQQRIFKRLGRLKYLGIEHSKIKIGDYIEVLEQNGTLVPNWLRIAAKHHPDLTIDFLKYDSTKKQKAEHVFEELSFIKSLLEDFSSLIDLSPNDLVLSHSHTTYLMVFSPELFLIALEQIYRSEAADYILTAEISSTEGLLEIEARDARPVLITSLRQREIHDYQDVDPFLACLHDLLHLFSFSSKTRKVRQMAVILGKAIFGISEELGKHLANNKVISHIIELTYKDSYGEGLDFCRAVFRRLKLENLFSDLHIREIYERLSQLLQENRDKEEILKIYRTVFEFEPSTSSPLRDSCLMTGARELILGKQGGANSSLLIGGLALGYAVNPLLGLVAIAGGIGIYWFCRFVFRHIGSSTELKSEVQSPDCLIAAYRQQLREERRFVSIDFIDSPQTNWSENEKREIREFFGSIPFPLRKTWNGKPARLLKNTQSELGQDEKIFAQHLPWYDSEGDAIVFYGKFFGQNILIKFRILAHELAHRIAALYPSIESSYVKLSSWKWFNLSFQREMIPDYNNSDVAKQNGSEEFAEAVAEAISNPEKFRYHCLIEPRQKGLSDEQIARFRKKWDLIRGEMLGLSDALIQAVVEDLLLEVDIDRQKAQKIIGDFFQQAQLTTTAIQFESLRQEFIGKLKAEKQIHSSETIAPIQNSSISSNSAVDNSWQTVILDDDAISFCNESLDQLDSPDCVLQDSPEENYYPKREYEKVLRGVLAREISFAEAVVQLDGILREDYIRESIIKYPFMKGRQRFVFKNGIRGEADCLTLQEDQCPEELEFFGGVYHTAFPTESDFDIYRRPITIPFPSARDILTSISKRAGYKVKPMATKAHILQVFKMGRDKTRPVWITPIRIKGVHNIKESHPYLAGVVHDLSHAGQMAESLVIRGLSDSQREALLDIFEILIHSPLREQCLDSESLGAYLLDVVTNFEISLSFAFGIIKRFQPTVEVVLEIDRRLRTRFSEESDQDIIYEFRDNFPDVLFPSLETSIQAPASLKSSSLPSAVNEFEARDPWVQKTRQVPSSSTELPQEVRKGITRILEASAKRGEETIIDRWRASISLLFKIESEKLSPPSEVAVENRKNGPITLEEIQNFHKADPSYIEYSRRFEASDIVPGIVASYEPSNSGIYCSYRFPLNPSGLNGTAYRIAMGERVGLELDSDEYVLLGSTDYLSCAAFALRGRTREGKEVLMVGHIYDDDPTGQLPRLKSEIDLLKNQGGQELEVFVAYYSDLSELSISRDLVAHAFPENLEEFQKQIPSDVKVIGYEPAKIGRNRRPLPRNLYVSRNGVAMWDNPFHPFNRESNVSGDEKLRYYSWGAEGLMPSTSATTQKTGTRVPGTRVSAEVSDTFSAQDPRQKGIGNTDTLLIVGAAGLIGVAGTIAVVAIKAGAIGAAMLVGGITAGILAIGIAGILSVRNRPVKAVESTEKIHPADLIQAFYQQIEDEKKKLNVEFIDSPHAQWSKNEKENIEMKFGFIPYSLRKNLNDRPIRFQKGDKESFQPHENAYAAYHHSSQTICCYQDFFDQSPLQQVATIAHELAHRFGALHPEIESEFGTLSDWRGFSLFEDLRIVFLQNGFTFRNFVPYLSNLAQGIYQFYVKKRFPKDVRLEIGNRLFIGGLYSVDLEMIPNYTGGAYGTTDWAEDFAEAVGEAIGFVYLGVGEKVETFRHRLLEQPVLDQLPADKIERFKKKWDLVRGSVLGLSDALIHALAEQMIAETGVDRERAQASIESFIQRAQEVTTATRLDELRREHASHLYCLKRSMDDEYKKITLPTAVNEFEGKNPMNQHWVGKMRQVPSNSEELPKKVRQGITRILKASGKTGWEYGNLTFQLGNRVFEYMTETGVGIITSQDPKRVGGEEYAKAVTYFLREFSYQAPGLRNQPVTIYQFHTHPMRDAGPLIQVPIFTHTDGESYTHFNGGDQEAAQKLFDLVVERLRSGGYTGTIRIISGAVPSGTESKNPYISTFTWSTKNQKKMPVSAAPINSKQKLESSALAVLAVSAITVGPLITVAIALAVSALGLSIAAYQKGKAVVQKRMIDPWRRMKAGILAVSDPTSNPFPPIIAEVIGEKQPPEVTSLDQARIDRIIRQGRDSSPKTNMEGELLRLSLKGSDAIVLLIELIRDNLKKLSFTGIIHEDKNMSVVLVYLTDHGEAEIFWDNIEPMGNKETVNGKAAIEIPILLLKETRDGKEKVIIAAIFLSDSSADYQRARRAYHVATQLRTLEGENLLDDNLVEEFFPPEKEVIPFSTEGGMKAPLRLVKGGEDSPRLSGIESAFDADFDLARGKIARNCTDLFPVFSSRFLSGMGQMRFEESPDFSGELANVVVLLTEEREFEIQWNDEAILHSNERKVGNRKAYPVWVQIFRRKETGDKKIITIDAVHVPQETTSSTVHPIALQMESDLEGKELMAPAQQRITGEYPAMIRADGLTDFQIGQVLEAIQGRSVTTAIYRSVQDYLGQHANSSTLSLEFDLILNGNGKISSGSPFQKKENYLVHFSLMRVRAKRGILVFEIRKVVLQKGKSADLHEENMEYALKNFQQAKYIAPSQNPESTDFPRPPHSLNPQKGVSQIEAMATMAAVAFPVAMGTVSGLSAGIIAAGTLIAAGSLIMGARVIYEKQRHRASIQWTAAISFLAASLPFLAQATEEIHSGQGGIFTSGIWGEVFPVLIPVVFAGLLPSPLYYRGRGVDQREKIHDFLRVKYATRKGDARFLWRVLKASHNDSAIKSKLDELDRKKDHSPEEKEILGERDEIKKLLNEMETIEQEAIPLLNHSWEEGTEEGNWQKWENIRKRLEEKSDQAREKIEALREKCKKIRLDERKRERAVRSHPTEAASPVVTPPVSEQVKESPKIESQEANATATVDPKIEFSKINYKDLEAEMAVMRGDAISIAVLRNGLNVFRTEKVQRLLQDNTDTAVLSRIDRVRKLISDLERLLNRNWENNEIEARNRECQKIIQQIESLKEELKAFKENLIRLKDAVTEALEEVSDDKPEIVVPAIPALSKPEEAASEKPVLRSPTTKSSDENPTPPVNYKGTHIKFF